MALATLRIGIAGAGAGRVTSVAGAPVDCAAACAVTVRVGDTIALGAVPSGGSYFEGWSGACAGMSCEVTVRSDTAVTATFGPTLTVLKSGSGDGVVTSDIGGISCGPICVTNLSSGASVTLTARPDVSMRFAGWGVPGCSGLGPCTIAMTAVRRVTASFVRLVTLSVSLAGSGRGTVTSTPTGINCGWITVPSLAAGSPVQGPACTQVYDLGTSLTLTAKAQADSRFDAFGGACGGLACAALVMDADKRVTATFIRRVTLTVSVTDGAGNPATTRGSVTSDLAGISCPSDCVETYDVGTKITLLPQPFRGYFFQGWRDQTCAAFGTKPCALTLDRDVSVTAPFQFIITRPEPSERSGAQIVF